MVTPNRFRTSVVPSGWPRMAVVGVILTIAVVELHVGHHSPGNSVGDPLAHVMLWSHDVMHPELD